MRILIYMPSFRGGGAERNSVLLGRQFARMGHMVTIAVDRKDGPNRNLLPECIETVQVGDGGHLVNVRYLRRLVRRLKPDIVFARLGLSPLKILLGCVGLVQWTKIVVSYHNLFEPDSAVGGRCTWYLSSVITRVAGATIAVSGDIRDQLTRSFRASTRKICVVHNPVDLEWIDSQAEREPPAFLRGRKYILAVGRLMPQKGFATLIRAFVQFQGRVPHDLVILGEGPLRGSLESLVVNYDLSDRVLLPGYLDNPFPVYRNADLFALSSQSEGFGNVLVEALALNTPVVATDCPGGPREILKYGRYGTLVPMGDQEALADAMFRELYAPKKRTGLRERAASFAVVKVAAEYLDVAMCKRRA